MRNFVAASVIPVAVTYAWAGRAYDFNYAHYYAFFGASNVDRWLDRFDGEDTLHLLLHLGMDLSVFRISSTSHAFLGGGLYVAGEWKSLIDTEAVWYPKVIQVGGGIKGALYSTKTGFFVDLVSHRPNLFVKAKTHLSNSSFSIGGFVNYYLTFTLPQRDIGNWLILGARGGISFYIFEVGVEPRYILRSPIKNENGTLYSYGYLFSLAPYVQLNWTDRYYSKWNLVFKLSTRDEYTDYGIPVLSTNFPTTWGFTLGAVLMLTEAGSRSCFSTNCTNW